LFNAHESESNISGIRKQIDILKDANKKEDSYLSVISGNDTIDKSNLSSFDVHMIRQKSVILCIALTPAVENMNKWTWLHCCKRALKAAERIGIGIARNPRTVQNWYIAFRGARRFTVPLQRKHNLPPFLQLNPDACHAMKTFRLTNLSILSVESMSEFLHANVLPAMALKDRQKSIQDDGGQSIEADTSSSEEEEVQRILKRYCLKNLCLSTVNNWMKLLGFHYDYRRKGFYVDGHEKGGTIAYREKFCERYLERERKMLRWIQIGEADAKLYEEKGEIPTETGYRYVDDAGRNMVEYHVDDCNDFHKIMEAETIFGGRRSVRFTEDERCTVIIEHDEAVIKQFLLTNKGWFGPNGEMAIMPKDEGHGLMISGFVSRELGFGWDITEEQYAAINRSREGQKYMDQDAAKKVKGSADKQPLVKDPSIFEFEPGTNAQGWWTYDHFVLQIEDVCDVLRGL